MNGWIIALLVFFGIVVVFLLCWGIIEYRYTLKYTVVPIPKSTTDIFNSGVTIPNLCDPTIDSQFFIGSSFNTQSIQEIEYAYY